MALPFVLSAPTGLARMSVPRAGLAQALLSLVKNAFDATADHGARVMIEVTATAESYRVAIEDQRVGRRGRWFRLVGVSQAATASRASKVAMGAKCDDRSEKQPSDG